jgi:hypothetical protein
MSAWVLLAAALGLMVLCARLAKTYRPAWVGDFARGLQRAATTMFAVLLASIVIVSIYASVVGDAIAGKTLLQIEAGLDETQRLRQSILGPWDWKLIVTGIALAISGALFALPELTGMYTRLKAVRTPAAVLALLAGLTVSSIGTADALGALELRYGEAKGRIEAEAAAIERQVEVAVRAEVINEVFLKVLDCLDEDASVCTPIFNGYFPPPQSWLIEHPQIEPIWNGEGGASRLSQLIAEHAQGNPSSAQPTAPRETYAGVNLEALQEISVDVPAPETTRQSTEDMRSARDDLIDLAVTAGFETGLDAAKDLGAHGDVVEAMLAPLVSSALKALLKVWTQRAVSAAFGGDRATLRALMDTQIRDEFRDAARTADVRAQFARAHESVKAALGRAERASGPTLAQWRTDQAFGASSGVGGGAQGGPSWSGPGYTGVQPGPPVVPPTIPGGGMAKIPKVTGRPIR